MYGYLHVPTVSAPAETSQTADGPNGEQFSSPPDTECLCLSSYSKGNSVMDTGASVNGLDGNSSF